jgi:hypothetical protein
VVGGQQDVGAVGIGDAGVGQQPDARRLGRLDGVLMLGDALTGLASGDQQDLVGTAKASRRESMSS